MKQKKKSSIMEQVKASRKQSREEELKVHGKVINYQKVMATKKLYNRKKNKADDEVLPYFFFDKSEINRSIITTSNEVYQIETRFSTGTNMGSPATTPKALYHAAI